MGRRQAWGAGGEAQSGSPLHLLLPWGPLLWSYSLTSETGESMSQAQWVLRPPADPIRRPGCACCCQSGWAGRGPAISWAPPLAQALDWETWRCVWLLEEGWAWAGGGWESSPGRSALVWKSSTPSSMPGRPSGLGKESH